MYLVIGIIFGAVVYASFFEYNLHRHMMHKPVRTPFGTFIYPFKAHACVHHHVFSFDETYHLQRPEDWRIIPMAWWNGPVLVLVGTFPAVLLGLLLHHWWVAPICAFVFLAYYGAYEYIHLCMHKPEAKRFIERTPVLRRFFRRLNGHHLLHHRQMGKNFNVVLPLFDLIYGTLVLRSKTHFKQATGPSVPDVQPKKPRAPKVRPGIRLA